MRIGRAPSGLYSGRHGTEASAASTALAGTEPEAASGRRPRWAVGYTEATKSGWSRVNAKDSRAYKVALLELRNLHVALEDGTEIVKGVDLAVDTDEVHAIMGPNGRASRRSPTRSWATRPTRSPRARSSSTART